MENLRQELHKVEAQAAISSTNFESTKVELERALPFEKEVKEKNLLIGKLRHEAVILNDHLTKALRYLKKGKPEDTIDKYAFRNGSRLGASLTQTGCSLRIISCTFWLWIVATSKSSKSCRSSPASLAGLTVSHKSISPFLADLSELRTTRASRPGSTRRVKSKCQNTDVPMAPHTEYPCLVYRLLSGQCG